jgi:hypothetical protein
LYPVDDDPFEVKTKKVAPLEPFIAPVFAVKTVDVLRGGFPEVDFAFDILFGLVNLFFPGRIFLGVKGIGGFIDR